MTRAWDVALIAIMSRTIFIYLTVVYIFSLIQNMLSSAPIKFTEGVLQK